MSSVAGPVSPAGRGRALIRRRAVALPVVSVDASVCGGVALALGGVAFGASGGTELGRTTVTEILLILGGALLAAAAIVSPRARRGRLHGAWTLAALAALTALSIAWSLAPSESWVEANRMLAYLAVLAGSLGLVRLAPESWPAMLGGVALGCTAISAWALITKVFPGALSPDETFARLRAPYDYWNAVGLTAALGVPPLLWLASKRSGNLAVNALAYPALGTAFVCLMLAYSRGSLLALVAGLAFWFAVVPLRLRAVAALAVSGAGAALVVAWGFGQEALTADQVPLVARIQAGHELGALLALMAVLLLAAGLAIGFAAANRAPTLRTRRRVGTSLVALVALLPVLGLVALATQPGGIDGQVSDRFAELTEPTAGTPSNSPERLTATASVRSRYWREAIDIFGEHRLAGAGAGSFAIARTRFQTGRLEVRQAHGYVVETLASLGLIGLGLSLALLAAWLAAAARATGLRRRDRGLPMDAERVGLLTLATVVVVFGVHSLVDWTWLVPGTAVIGLACAGWVAGRGPLRDRLTGRPEIPDPAPRPSVRAILRSRAGRRDIARSPRVPLAAALVGLALAASWAAFQPLRGANASDAAYDRLDRNQPEAALDIARIGVSRNPLSADRRFDLASIQDATGRPRDAEKTLERAVELQPANAEAWRRLGEYRTLALLEPQSALGPLRAAYYLDPTSAETETAFLNLRRILAGQQSPG